MNLRSKALFGAVSFASIVGGGGALAQTAAAPPATVPNAATGQPTGTQVYDQAFFARYNLNTAEDMLRRLPEVSSILDSAGTTNQARGLGSGGDQILIGGKRVASKSQLAATLRRIPAANIQRIELIRGTSGELDVLSEGMVINVVLKDGVGVGGVGNYEINYRFDDLSWSDFDGLISYSGGLGRLRYVLAAEQNLWTPLGQTPTGGANDFTRRTRIEQYFYPSGQLQEYRPQKFKREHHKRIFTANLTYDFNNGDEARLNALWQPFPVKESDFTDVQRYSVAGLPTTIAYEEHYRRTRRDLVELSGEIEKKIGPGKASLILIHTRNSVPMTDYRNRYESFGMVEVSRSANEQDTGEDIARASYSWSPAKGQDLTLGFEAARNTLAQTLQVYFDLNRDGRLDPVTIPTAHAEVEEQRGEAFAIHNWKITPKLTLESSLNIELSRITTNYPFIPVKNYRFPKPRIDLRYNFTPRDRLRLKIERTVSQLDFNNFVPVYNVIDTRIDAGNPSIAPEKAWVFELGHEHRLKNDSGSVEARGFYRNISDHIDRGPFGTTNAGLPGSTPININKARLYGLEVKAGVRLTALGMRNALVNARYLIQKSSLIDPFTGRERKMRDPYNTEITLGFRHDLTRLRASYGATMQETVGSQLVSDIRNLEYFSRAPRFELFVEKALWGPVTLRVEAYNLTRSHENKQRFLYAASQADGRLVRSEIYEERRDRRFAIRLRGKF